VGEKKQRKNDSSNESQAKEDPGVFERDRNGKMV